MSRVSCFLVRLSVACFVFGVSTCFGDALDRIELVSVANVRGPFTATSAQRVYLLEGDVFSVVVDVQWRLDSQHLPSEPAAHFRAGAGDDCVAPTSAEREVGTRACGATPEQRGNLDLGRNERTGSTAAVAAPPAVQVCVVIEAEPLASSDGSAALWVPLLFGTSCRVAIAVPTNSTTRDGATRAPTTRLVFDDLVIGPTARQRGLMLAVEGCIDGDAVASRLCSAQRRRRSSDFVPLGVHTHHLPVAHRLRLQPSSSVDGGATEATKVGAVRPFRSVVFYLDLPESMTSRSNRDDKVSSPSKPFIVSIAVQARGTKSDRADFEATPAPLLLLSAYAKAPIDAPSGVDTPLADGGIEYGGRVHIRFDPELEASVPATLFIVVFGGGPDGTKTTATDFDLKVSVSVEDALIALPFAPPPDEQSESWAQSTFKFLQSAGEFALVVGELLLELL